ncbi:MAG: molecular chaperone [Pseudomonadota bacterium]|nr:molecular chaperone [Pseudomonadota bacterium]
MVTLAALLICSAQATAQLMVHPTRIVLENDERSAQLEIINNSDKPTVYRISLVNRRMDEVGGFSPIEAALPGEQFVDGMVRYSPRRVALAPGASQIVRVMARKPADLASGEYRSHLLFAEQDDPAARSAAAGSSNGEIGVSLTALVGVSIPVIVRHGATAATVALGQLALELSAAGGIPMLSLEMSRTGNRSVHGDLAVDFVPAGGGAAVTVGRAGGVAVYTPNLLRLARLPLVFPPGASVKGGTLRVSYREPPERGGALLAEASLLLP